MSKAKPEPDTDTNKTYTPQPSTPIKHAGSDCPWKIWEGERKNINKDIQMPTRIL